MPRMTRTFVAIAVPELLGAKLTRLQGSSPPRSRRPLVGDIPVPHDPRVPGRCRGRRPQARLRGRGGCGGGLRAVRAPPGRAGRLPRPTRARVVWVGLTGPGLSALTELRGRVARAITSTLSLPVDAVLTARHPGPAQGRSGNPLDLAPLLKHYRTWAAGSFPVTEVITFASTLTPDGPVYARLGTAPLRQGLGPAGTHPPSVDPGEDEA